MLGKNIKQALRFFALCAILFSSQQGWAAELPSSPVQDSDPFNNPAVHELGQPMACNYVQNLDCQHLDQGQILKAANACARRFYGFSSDYMTEFRIEGDYANCAVPTGYQPQDAVGMAGKAQWPICCVIDNGQGVCNLECHSMYIQ